MSAQPSALTTVQLNMESDVATTINLNEYSPTADGNYPDTVNQDNSTASTDSKFQVYFRDLAPRLIQHIAEADIVLGCVAWLTHNDILEALRPKDVAIVVQKEDFLRPDLLAGTDWKTKLRNKYGALSCGLDRYAFSNMIGHLSTSSDPSLDAVRCVGNYNRDKNPAFPRMHNKFLVFARKVRSDDIDTVAPYAVWTGSFNLTYNATASLENALYITDSNIVKAYFNEYGQIMAISEPLDWEESWCAPEFRIGS